MAKTTKTKKRKSTVKHLDHDRVLKLYKDLGKSIQAVADKIGASYMGVRRVLILERAYRP